MADSNISPFYPAIGTIAAAAIAAIYSAWRLIGEKETKVSEFRKSWVETFRSKLADFTASGHIIIGRISILTSDGDSENQKSKTKVDGWRKKLVTLISPQLMNQYTEKTTIYDRELQSELLPHWADLRVAYNSIILHLNPSEHAALTCAERFVETRKLAKDDSEEYENYLESLLYLAKEFSDNDVHENSKSLISRLCFCNKSKDSDSRISQKGVFEPKRCDDSIINLIGETKDNIKEIAKLDCKAAEALLLSMFATKKLLEAKKYETVYSRRQAIEFGITIIDSAGSKVIKKVWQEIKKGESRYNLVTTLSLWIAPPILIGALFLFFKYHSQTEKEASTTKIQEKPQKCWTIHYSKPKFQASIANPVVEWLNPESVICNQRISE